MDVSYNKLFKLLIDKSMKKTDLRLATGISPNTLTKLSNNEYVSMEVLVKICRVLGLFLFGKAGRISGRKISLLWDSP